MEGILKSETICNFKFFPYHNSSSSKLTFFNFELTRDDIEYVIQLC